MTSRLHRQQRRHLSTAVDVDDDAQSKCSSHIGDGDGYERSDGAHVVLQQSQCAATNASGAGVGRQTAIEFALDGRHG